MHCSPPKKQTWWGLPCHLLFSPPSPAPALHSQPQPCMKTETLESAGGGGWERFAWKATTECEGCWGGKQVSTCWCSKVSEQTFFISNTQTNVLICMAVKVQQLLKNAQLITIRLGYNSIELSRLKKKVLLPHIVALCWFRWIFYVCFISEG